jgi:uncharacterized membrane protein (UPF0127 family)
MDRRTTIIILFFVVVCFASFSTLRRSYTSVQVSCKTLHDTYDIKRILIDNKNFNVLVADSPSKWEYGLMNVKSKKDICGHDGMIFTFPIAMPQTFWNKNTLVDLDIYWMNGEKKVGQGKLPAITKSGLTTVSSPEAVDRVVEIIR